MLARISTVFMGIAVIWLHYSLWWGNNNLRDYYRLRREVQQQQQINAEIIKENQRIWSDVHALTYGTETIEELARSKLNMIKPDELFYSLPSKQVNKADEAK